MSEVLNAEEIWRLFRETDRKLQEMFTRSTQETDRRFQETDRRFQETDRKFQETREFIDRLGKKWDDQLGKLGNRLGDFVEGIVAPAVVKLFQGRGIEVHEVYRQVVAQREAVSMEIDLLVVNDDELVAVEVKSKLTTDDVREHIERLKRFHLAFPRYKGVRVFGAVAGMVIPAEVARFAYHKGLFVLGQSGEGVVILNDAQFQPKAW
jgi:hypothetical protein